MSITPLYVQNASKKTLNNPTLKALPKAILAVTLVSIGTAHASEYSSVTFFGDSLTDGGYFKPVTDGLFIKDAGQFTTNPDPSWATPFAEKLGYKAVANTRTPLGGQTQDGNNYAIGGALAGDDTSQLGMKILSTKNQLDNYLDNKVVDPDGLYALWVGANDIFGSDNNFNYDKPKAVNAIKKAAADEVEGIQTLHDNGAKYILVPNVPDLGSTPDAIEAETRIVLPNKEAREKSTAAAKLYNKTLYDAAAKTDANIIPLDTFSLLKEATENPSLYGLVNVEEKACGNTSSLMCKESNLVSPDAKDNYLFADGVHPTGRVHRIIADYAHSVVTSPSEMGALPHIATTSGMETKKHLNTHIDQVKHQKSSKRNSGPAVWASADIGKVDVAGFEDGSNNQLLLGLDFSHSGSSSALTGFYANIAQTELDKSVEVGISDIEVDEVGLGVYHSNKIGGAELSAALGYGRLDIDANRKVVLDDYKEEFKSNGDGDRFYASLNVGYPFSFGNTSITPYLEATHNKVKVGTMKEKEMLSRTMQFEEQKYDTTYGTVGIKASSFIDDEWLLYSDIYYQNRLSENQKEVSARLNTVSEISFTTPMTEFGEDDRYGATLGISRNIGNLQANIGASYLGGDNDESTSVFIGLSRSF